MLTAALWYATIRTGAIISTSLGKWGSEQFGSSSEITQLVRSPVRSQGRCFSIVWAWYKMKSVDPCFSGKFKSCALFLPPSKTISWFSALSWGRLAACHQCYVAILWSNNSTPRYIAKKIESRDLNNICTAIVIAALFTGLVAQYCIQNQDNWVLVPAFSVHFLFWALVFSSVKWVDEFQGHFCL